LAAADQQGARAPSVWRPERGLLTGAGSFGLELIAGGCWRNDGKRAAREASAGEAFGARAMLLTSDAERAVAGKSLLTGDRRSGVAVAKRLAKLLTGCWQTTGGRAIGS
jgi:hypothetical protein